MYTQGCYLISEDLSNGSQELFYNPVEEISTIAMQYDERIVAVGASYNQSTKFGPIFIWDLANKRVEKVIYTSNSPICKSVNQLFPFILII